MILKLIRKVVQYIIDPVYLMSLYQTKINSKKLNQITISKNSSIYNETHICNMQKRPDKIKIGQFSHIRGSLQIFTQGGEIIIGDYCYVGENTKIWSAEKIQIGNNVLIAHNVNIHDNISHPISAKERHADYKRIIGIEKIDATLFDLRTKPVIIKNDAWIGFNSIILKGVTIGEGAIVGAGSLVTKNVPDFAVVVGNPAQIIKYTE
jgi:acetyltransferase-like isoleucine patch superfamily enzyme